MHLEGNVVLIVDAASSDVSWQAAQLFASAGCRLVLHDAGSSVAATEALAARAASLHGDGYEALAILAELDAPEQLDALLSRVTGGWGQLDGVVLPPLKQASSVNLSFLAATPDSVRASLTALRAHVNVQRAAARVMAQGAAGGQIVHLSDVTRAAPYTQAGSTAFAACLRAELFDFGVSVRALNLAQLGLELLAQTPAENSLEPDENSPELDENSPELNATSPSETSDNLKLTLSDTVLPRGRKKQRSAAVLSERLGKDLAAGDLAGNDLTARNLTARNLTASNLDNNDFGAGEFSLGDTKDFSPST